MPAGGGVPSTVEAPVRPRTPQGAVAVAIAPSGAAAAAWIGTSFGSRPSCVYVATRQPGQAFGPAEEVPISTDDNGGWIALAVGDDGAVTLACAGMSFAPGRRPGRSAGGLAELHHHDRYDGERLRLFGSFEPPSTAAGR